MNRIRKERRKAGLTMTQLALGASVSLPNLSLIERDFPCRKTTGRRLALVLGKKPQDLFADWARMRGA